jgi:hypothetical protein
LIEIVKMEEGIFRISAQLSLATYSENALPLLLDLTQAVGLSSGVYGLHQCQVNIKSKGKL